MKIDIQRNKMQGMNIAAVRNISQKSKRPPPQAMALLDGHRPKAERV
jgi:hypothetical protein